MFYGARIIGDSCSLTDQDDSHVFTIDKTMDTDKKTNEHESQIIFVTLKIIISYISFYSRLNVRSKNFVDNNELFDNKRLFCLSTQKENGITAVSLCLP